MIHRHIEADAPQPVRPSDPGPLRLPGHTAGVTDSDFSSSESESMVDLNKTVSRTSDRALAGPRVLPISKFNLKFKCISLSQVLLRDIDFATAIVRHEMSTLMLWIRPDTASQDCTPGLSGGEPARLCLPARTLLLFFPHPHLHPLLPPQRRCQPD